MPEDFKDKACENMKSVEKKPFSDVSKAIHDLQHPPGPLPKFTECDAAEAQKKHMENAAHTGANTGAQTGAQKGPQPVKR